MKARHRYLVEKQRPGEPYRWDVFYYTDDLEDLWDQVPRTRDYRVIDTKLNICRRMSRFSCLDWLKAWVWQHGPA